MFVPSIVFYRFLRETESAEGSLRRLQALYGESLAFRSGKYSSLDLAEVQCTRNTIAHGLNFRHNNIVDRWDVHFVDKGVKFVYAEVLWTDPLDNASRADTVRLHEAVATGLVRDDPGVIVGLQHSKRLRPTYQSSFNLQRLFTGRFLLIGSDVDLFLFQRHFRELTELSRNPSVASVPGSDFYKLRSLVEKSYGETKATVVRESDIKQFAADFASKLGNDLSAELKAAWKASGSTVPQDVDYSY